MTPERLKEIRERIERDHGWGVMNFTRTDIGVFVRMRFPSACVLIQENFPVPWSRPWWAFWRKPPPGKPNVVITIGTDTIATPLRQEEMRLALEEIVPAGIFAELVFAEQIEHDEP